LGVRVSGGAADRHEEAGAGWGGATPCDGTPVGVQTKRKRPLRPNQCEKYLQKALSAKFEAIVEGFLKEAQKGGCAHMKLCVELLEPKEEEKAGTLDRFLEEFGQ
jgi:hypothetical protein